MAGAVIKVVLDAVDVAALQLLARTEEAPADTVRRILLEAAELEEVERSVERLISVSRTTRGKADRHARIRMHCEAAAGAIVAETPECREQSLAITAMEEAMMWANAAIARNPEVGT
ncbi:MAG: Acb2/Tad1 domain-containing protein [Candidatus Dormibacteria bacterium]